MKKWMASSLIVLTALMTACSPEAPRQEAQEERYTSPVVRGSAAEINLEAVEQAFFSSKGNDFSAWMGAFEKRVNEIYQGAEIVSIDAERKGDRLVVQGFIDQNQTAGLQSEDKTLFSLEQTGPATRDAVPYRVSDGQGNVYHQGSHSLLDNPFLQGFLIAGMFNWVGSYFTPYNRTLALRDYRTGYRNTPAYQRQIAANTRFRARADGGVRSRTPFDDRRPAATDTQRRSWAGRRTTGGGGGMQRRSWGGRRR